MNLSIGAGLTVSSICAMVCVITWFVTAYPTASKTIARTPPGCRVEFATDDRGYEFFAETNTFYWFARSDGKCYAEDSPALLSQVKRLWRVWGAGI